MNRAILTTAMFVLFTFHLCALAADGKSWVELGELTASEGQAYDRFGCSVAMRGNTIVVGATEDMNDLTGAGAVYVFVEPAAGGTQTAKLTASDGQRGDLFGATVAISDDTIVVGAPFANMSQGAVYVFLKPASGWANMTETAKLTASDGMAQDEFGFSTAISGNTIVTGAPHEHPSGIAIELGKSTSSVNRSGGGRT